jgi:hypothetical protein
MAKWTLPRRETSGQCGQTGSGDRTIGIARESLNPSVNTPEQKELPVFHDFSCRTPPRAPSSKPPKKKFEEIAGQIFGKTDQALRPMGIP